MVERAEKEKAKILVERVDKGQETEILVERAEKEEEAMILVQRAESVQKRKKKLGFW